MKYRNDIDGLRAIAILSIMLFHFGINTLSGGYVGVDIFFVISGYLITKIIYQEVITNTFRFKSFYFRRVRRILPGLLSVLMLTSMVSFKLFYPVELLAYTRSALAALFFSANMYFYEVLNYFSPSADQIPLLHLWSLGVEEQFYLVFPLLIYFLIVRFPKKLSITVFSVFLLSVLLSAHILKIFPMMSFYLLPFRAFEFLIGTLIAIESLPKISYRPLAAFLSLMGLASILYAVFMFDVATPFPGFSALIPCLGAGLIIWAGEKNNVNWYLQYKPLVWTGKISYSLYLVHWPLVVFAKHIYTPAGQVEYLITMLIFAFFLAYINYIYVEQAFRYGVKQISPQKSAIATSFIFSGCVLAFLITIYANGFSNRLDEKISGVIAYLKYDSKPVYLTGTCFQTPDQQPQEMPINRCISSKSNNQIILWGDSHATQFYHGLKGRFIGQGYTLGVLTATSCPPIIGLESSANPNCKKFNNYMLPIIVKAHPKMVILSAHWPVDEKNMGLLEKTIQILAKNHIQVVLLGESPLYKKDVPNIIADRMLHEQMFDAAPDMLDADFLAQAEITMLKHFGHRRDVKYISVMDIMCINKECPLVAANGKPAHFDIAHLTAEGSTLFAIKLTPAILSS